MRAHELLNVPTPNVSEIAKKHNTTTKTVSAKLAKGTQVEMEHTTDSAIAREIALDHISEMLDYYDQLEKMEESTNITESIMTRPLVVVDVQPAYSYHINFGKKLAKLIEKRSGETLMYVNAEDTGTSEDTIEDIKKYWWRMEMEEDTINSLTWYDKGYGNLREAMDSGADDAAIIAVIRGMFSQKVNDSRDLFDGVYGKQKEAYGEDNMDWIQYGISIMDLNGYDNLKRMSPFYLCGGGKNECLKEVMLMCNALNIKYKLINEFVY